MDPPSLLAVNDQHLQLPFIQQTFMEWLQMKLNSKRSFTKRFDVLVLDLKKLVEKENITDLNNWVLLSCGIRDLPYEEIIILWIHVLWFQSQNKNHKALECLEVAQKAAVESQGIFSAPPGQHNALVCEAEHDEDTDMETGATPLLALPTTFNSRNHTAWNKALDSYESQFAVCTHFTEDFKDFFILKVTDTPVHAVDALRKMRAVSPRIYQTASWELSVRKTGLAAVVNEICQPDTDLERASSIIAQSFRMHCWKESLGEVFDKWMQSPSPDLQMQSLCTCDSEACHSDFHLKTFIEALGAKDCIIPTESNPSSIFFLVNLDNFTDAWKNWLLPSLKKQGILACFWNIQQVHRAVRGISPKTIPNIHPRLSLIMTETLKLVKLAKSAREHVFRPVRRTGVKLTKQEQASDSLKYAMKKGKVSVPGNISSSQSSAESSSTFDQGLSNNTCIHCKDMPLEEQCLVTILVTRRDISGLQNSALTCAPADDRLPPLTSKESKSKFSGVYHTPEKLGLRKIAHRPDVFKRCCKDVFVLLNAENPTELVGAVVFNAFEKKILQQMLQNHDHASRLPPLSRGSSFNAWRYGIMRAIGSRMPKGGRPGDAYALYSGLDAGNDEEIQTLFGHAQNADILVNVARAISRPLTSNVGHHSADESGLNRLGSTGSNIFSCSNYMSHQHFDQDEDISICAQYEKTCLQDEFNFSYTEWGVYIETRDNTLWLFHSNHLHGTIMPRLSSWNSWQVDDNASLHQPQGQYHEIAPGGPGAQAGPANANIPVAHHNYNLRPRDANGRVVVSGGDHLTRRRRDTRRARQIQEIRSRLHTRQHYWREQGAT
ncbi:hypothetical protein H0H93_007012 [Arthromyces matolae]|nr:hypothetical protein H0H93_007012 [Arthromyces matolae]